MTLANAMMSHVENAYAKLQREEKRLAKKLKSLTEQAEDLQDKQQDYFRALAKIRLDDLQQGRMGPLLTDGERDAQGDLEILDQKIAEIAQKSSSLTSALEAARTEETEKAAALTMAKEAVMRRITETRMHLDINPEWRDMLKRSAELKSQLTDATGKAELAAKNREEKAQAYRDDKLFSYLWDLGYGSTSYLGKGLKRLGDDFVAKMIGFEPARQNYVMLNELPGLLQDYFQIVQSAYDAMQEKLTAFKRAEMEADGILPLERAQGEADALFRAAHAKTTDIENALAPLGKERRALLDGNHTNGMEKILSDLSASLQEEDLFDLLRQACLTPSGEGDRIISRLLKIDRELYRLQLQIEIVEKEAEECADNYRELTAITQRIRQASEEEHENGISKGEIVTGLIVGILGIAAAAAGSASSKNSSSHVTDSSYGRRPGHRRSHVPDTYTPFESSGSYGGDLSHDSGSHSSGNETSSGGEYRTGGGF